MSDHSTRSVRLRYTATGALAALAAAGAIAGTSALAANPPATTPGHVTTAHHPTTKTPTSPAPGENGTPPQNANNPFVTAVQRLIDDGTITPTQGQALDRQIQQGNIDPSTLTGFTPTQLQAVQQALENTKRALAANASTKPAPDGNAPAPAGPGKDGPPPQNATHPSVAAVQRLVSDGTITATEGQVVDREILAGSVDPQTLASSGFTQTQLQAVEQALANIKRAL